MNTLGQVLREFLFLIFVHHALRVKFHFLSTVSLLFIFSKDPEDFLLFNSVGYSLQQGCEAQRHVKAFEQISSAPIPTAGHPT